MEIANVLRWRIIRGELAQGARVSEVAFANELGVSRAPIREALRELEQDGLVVPSPYRGVAVAELSASDLERTILPVRHLIETLAAERILTELTDDDFRQLDGFVEQMRLAEEGDSAIRLEQLVELDVLFHTYLIERADDYHLRQLWRSISPRMLAGFYKLGTLLSDSGDFVSDHQELIAALRTRDKATVHAALEDHGLTAPVRLLRQSAI